MAHRPSSRQLASVAEEFAGVRAAFTALDARVSDVDWTRRPTPTEWSVAECIAHLNLTSAAMVPLVRAVIDRAPRMAEGESRAYRGNFIGRVLASMVGPVRIFAGMKLGKVATTPPFVPGSELPRAAITAAFHRWQEEELQLVRDADGRAIDLVRIESPFRAGTFYDCYSALLILARHEMRHLVQAERALEALRT